MSGGGAWGKAVVRNELTGADQTPRMDLSGGIIGLTSGFNIQTGPVVLGLEGDISATNKKGSAAEFPPNAVFNNEVKERWLSTFRGRVGYAQDNWLLYATGGAALANVENTHRFRAWRPDFRQAVALGLDSRRRGRGQAHAGLDGKGRVSLRRAAGQIVFQPGTEPGVSSSQRLNLSDHIVRVGVNYKLPWNILDSFFKR